MKLRSWALALGSIALVASLALASTGVRVRYVQGIPHVELDGSYPQSRYTVYRATSPTGRYERLTQVEVLCMGSCYVQDVAAEPGRTYWYRFDLLLAEGGQASFGPFAVTISAELASRVGLAIAPNPMDGRTTVQIRLGGVPTDAPVRAEASVLDLQGRTVRTLLRGKSPRGVQSIEWRGDDDAGRPLPAGTYFVRVRSELGDRVARVLRVR